MYKLLFLFSIILIIISFSLAFAGINNWYFSAAVGLWLFFDYFTGENTAFQILQKNKKQFLFLYLMMMFLGCSIEYIGRFILEWWVYPMGNSLIYEFLLIIFYPFILFSFHGMYLFLSQVIKNKILVFISAMLLGMLIWETPNMFSHDWVYTISQTNLEIFNLNIIIIIGWSVLIGLPVYVHNNILRKR